MGAERVLFRVTRRHKVTANLTSLLHPVLVERRTEHGQPPSEFCTLLLFILPYLAVEPRRKHGSGNVFERVLYESAQSGTECGGRVLDRKEGVFADTDCGSLESVELVAATAHRFLLFFASDSPEESREAFSTMEARSLCWRRPKVQTFLMRA